MFPRFLNKKAPNQKTDEIESISRKPLRILLGNNTLKLLAGTETWTRTLALQLKSMGHRVECFSPVLGPVSEGLEDLGIRCRKKFWHSRWSWLQHLYWGRYDLIIANHNQVVRTLRGAFPRTPIISTVHGIIHTTHGKNGRTKAAPEHPALGCDVDLFVSVSEEVQNLLKEKYGINSVLVRNFFDLSWFKPRRPIAKKPSRILFNSNYNYPDSPEIEIMAEVARQLNGELITIGLNHQRVMDTRTMIEASDIVVGLGRSVLEGVAMGRLGLVHGHWGTGGVISESNAEVLRQCNFSGRNALGCFKSPEGILAEIRKHYTPENIRWGMDYVRREHNVVTAAQRYLDLGLGLFAPTPSSPIQRISSRARRFRAEWFKF